MDYDDSKYIRTYTPRQSRENAQTANPMMNEQSVGGKFEQFHFLGHQDKMTTL